MKYSKLIFFTCLVAFLLTCSTPQNPFTQDNAKVFLHLESSTKITSDSSITDTAGNKVLIGVSYFMPDYFDSIVITVSKSIQSVDTFFIVKKQDIKNDTAWLEYTFKDSGSRTITATGYVQGGYRPFAIATIKVIARPVVPLNHKPALILTGRKTITTAEACTLFVSANDSDTAQAHSFQVVKGPNGYTFANQIFTWKPTPADTGIDSVTFTVADNGVPVMSDTQTILLTVKAIPQVVDTIKPIIKFLDPAKDSLSINANSYTVKVVSKDTSGVVSVVFTLGAANFTATKSADTVWAATISGLVSGAFNKIMVIATDASVNANKDTLTFYIKYDPTMTDLTGPVFFQKSGPANNTIVADSIVNIVDSIYDPSGIDSVSWTLNGKNPKPLTLVSGTTNLYSLIDTLRHYHLDTIVIFAQDKSTNRNKSNQTIVLNYNVAPVTNDTAVSTNRNTAKTWTLNFQSVDGDALTWSRVTSPSVLSGTISGTLPSVTFTPATNWAGVDSFSVRTTDGYWSDTAKIKITVVNVPVAPSIITQPSSSTKNIGQSVTFSVAVNSDVNPAPSYQWKRNGNTITSATTSSYTVDSIKPADSGSYTVTVSNSAGTATSQAATLTVNYAPSMTTQPLSQTLYLNQPATFTVVATGVPKPAYQWRKNGAAINGATSASYTVSSPGVNDSGKYTVAVSNSLGSVISDTAKFYAVFKNVAAGSYHSLILKTDGTLWACGNNTYGQLGDGTNIYRSSPVHIMDSVQSMAAGESHSLILRFNGTLWACGNNTYGQLGDGTTNDHSKPALVNISNVESIATGGNHSLMVKGDGSLWACGDNSSGQLGDGTTINRSLPAQMTNMTNVQKVSAGDKHSIIVKNDGSLWVCGDNSSGQLGDGTANNCSLSVQVRRISVALDISAGGYHSMMLTNDAMLWACGSNGNGQLGDGTTNNNQSTPEQISSMSNVQTIAAGYYFSLILKKDGTLWACGWNLYGELGDGTMAERDTPIQMINMSNVQSMAAGKSHSLIIKKDGTLWACGWNGSGQLGTGVGDPSDHSTPVNISF